MFLEKFNYIKVRVNYEEEELEIRKEDVLKALKAFQEKEKISKNLVKAPVYYYLVSHNILFLDPVKRDFKVSK